MLFLAIVGVLLAREQRTYGSSLEQYIVEHNPRHAGDVERLTVEYNIKVKEGKI
jgi:hypothetical protein